MLHSDHSTEAACSHVILKSVGFVTQNQNCSLLIQSEQMKNIFPLFDSVLSLSLCQINNTYTTHYWYSQSNTRNIFLSFLTDLFNFILISLLACQINTCCLCSSRELFSMNVNFFLALSWFSGHPDTVSQSELDNISTPWISHFTVIVLQFCVSLPFL
jgi:hypothetical protein